MSREIANRFGTADHVRQRHAERIERLLTPPAPDETPELAEAWHRLVLHWLHVSPSYRAEIRERVSETARKVELRARRIDIGLGVIEPNPRYVPIPVSDVRSERRVQAGLRELLNEANRGPWGGDV